VAIPTSSDLAADGVIGMRGLSDHHGVESAIAIAWNTHKATYLTHSKTKLDLELKPEADHLVVATDAEALEGGTIIIALRKGEEPISAKFLSQEHEARHH